MPENPIHRRNIYAWSFSRRPGFSPKPHRNWNYKCPTCGIDGPIGGYYIRKKAKDGLHLHVAKEHGRPG